MCTSYIHMQNAAPSRTYRQMGAGTCSLQLPILQMEPNQGESSLVPRLAIPSGALELPQVCRAEHKPTIPSDQPNLASTRHNSYNNNNTHRHGTKLHSIQRH